MIERAHSEPPTDEPIVTDEQGMRVALREAHAALTEDEVPVGAVIYHKGQLVAKAHNQRETLNDPTAHAEMIAITQAAEALENWRLDECVMYVTLEPCAMCAGAIVLARLPRLVYGATDPKAGACESLYHIPTDPRLNHRPEVVSGILAEECGALLTDFFREKRQ